MHFKNRYMKILISSLWVGLFFTGCDKASIDDSLAVSAIIDDINGNVDGIAVTAEQLNAIPGVSGAKAGVDYTTALSRYYYVDRANPTADEIQAVIDAVNASIGTTETHSSDPASNNGMNDNTLLSNEDNNTEMISVGDTATQEGNVINDIISPVITLIGDSLVIVESGSSYIDEGASASDNKDGDISSNIIVNNSVNINRVGTYTITYDVKDAAGNSATQVSRTVIVQEDALTVALREGNASEVTTQKIYQGIEDTYNQEISRCKSLLGKIYPNGLKAKSTEGIKNVGGPLMIDSLGWIPLISSYNGGDVQHYLYMKEFANGTRVVVGNMPIFSQFSMGVNFNDGVDKSEMLNILKWLAQDKGESNGVLKSDVDFLNTPLKLMRNNRKSGYVYGYDENGQYYGWDKLWMVNTWIKENFSSLAGITLNSDGLPQSWEFINNNADDSVLDGKDIYLLNAATDAQIKQILAMADTGIPKGIYINVSPRSNYNAHNTITQTNVDWGSVTPKPYGDAPSIEAQCKSGVDGEIASLVADLREGNFDYTFPDANLSERMQNNRWDIRMSDGSKVQEYRDNTDSKTLYEKLFSKLDTLYRMTYSFDYLKKDVFADHNETTHRFYKLLHLLADKYREQIRYPMDKSDSDMMPFYKALFADNMVQYFRSTNHYQPKMGSFLNYDDDSNKYANNAVLHQMPTITKHISIATTKETEATAMGVYVPPGKPVVIKRTDTQNGVKAWIRIGFTRMNISHYVMVSNSMPFRKYTRPQNVSSRWFEIGAGESITLSTPYGAPLYLKWEAQQSNPKPELKLEVNNVLQHPVLNLDGSESDAQKIQEINDFSAQITASSNAFSWADIKTPFAEMHTRVGNMLSVVNNATYNGDVSKYVAYLNTYLILGNYHWAGFNGGGLAPLNTDVAEFCTAHSLDCTDPIIHQKPKIQHMNSDANSLCGNACAGNPIDFDHGIDPLAQLPNHEMGHNLQRARMTLPDGTEVSNLIFVNRTERAYAKDTAQSKFGKYDQVRVHFEDYFNLIKTNRDNNTAPVDNKGPLFSDHFGGVAFYGQLLWSSASAAQRDSNTMQNADDVWDFYTKMYLHERLFSDAISNAKNSTNESYWQSKRESLGFGDYSREEAKNISSIDYMVIFSSYLTSRDYSDYFAMWMLKVSDKAKAQIRNNGNTQTQPREYAYIPQPDDDGSGDIWWLNRLKWPVFLPDSWLDMGDSNVSYQAP